MKIAHFDTCYLSLPLLYMPEVGEALTGFLGEDPQRKGVTSWLWRETGTYLGKGLGDFAIVQLKGRFFESCSLAGLMGLVDDVDAITGLRWKCTRCDIALDLIRSGFTVANMVHLVAVRSLRARASGLHSCPVTGAAQTLYLGRRGRGGTGRFVRVYDKAAQAGLDFPCVRFELECGNRFNTAHEVFGQVRDAWRMVGEAGALEVMMSHLGGAFRFFDSPAADLDRRGLFELLGPWSSVQQAPLGEVVRTWDRRREHVRRSCAVHLARESLVCADGLQRFVDELVADGLTRLTADDHAMIEREKRRRGVCVVPF